MYRSLINLMASNAAPDEGSASDSDAQAFLTAAGITDGTIVAAIDDLVIDLKAAGIWTKCNTIYPFVGGSAAAHKFNLRDAQDTDGAYRITWSGTLTHDSNGVTGDGSTGYGVTNLNCSSILTVNDTHIAFYSRTSTSGANIYELGAFSSNSSQIRLASRNSDNAYTIMYGAGSNDLQSVFNADGRGFYVGSRRANNDLELYKNGSSIGTNTGTTTSTLPNAPMGILCTYREGVGAIALAAKNLAFASIGSSLTDAEVSDFNTIVQAFQVALSRNV